ncbi:hypothetical protein TR631_12510 [Streptomyces rochei]|uniref:hypothetical protein n=1 Tax=Streptomyces rochei TaxID=1928 RepID=UPI002ACDB7B2|nr:hypothetical protein [Streptomyces rochei]WQC12590.1 hypothetical protein TR631_12510 [Streptomyces rochei]
MSARTAPLPPAAVEEMARLERQLTGRSVADTLAHEAGSYVRVTPDVQRAVTRYEVAAARYAELATVDSRSMTGAEFQALADAQTVMADSVRVLTAAGQLHLIGGA